MLSASLRLAAAAFARCRSADWLPLGFLALLALAVPGRAATRNVPASYATIQAAVNASQSGDTVILEDGTYTGPGDVDVDFGGRNITITSQNGAATTIIDCGGSSSVYHRGFYLHNYETNAVISGLTIQNGYEGSTGGYGGGRGGGIYNFGAGLIVQDCVLKNNMAVGSGGIGGGIYSGTQNSSGFTVMNCTFTGNTANAGAGGGIYESPSSGVFTVTGCTFTGNTAGSGGGINNRNFGSSTFTVTNCTLTGNTASSGSGGGLYNSNGSSSTTSLTNCVFTGNAAGSGGGINNSNFGFGTFTVTNCTLTGNTANVGSGGGLYNANGYNSSGATSTLTNDILYGDAGGEVNAGSPGTFSHCDIQGGYLGAGNISADPVFVNTAGGDFHLQPASPCVGAGTSAGAPATDRDGSPRPNPPSIGAYEPVELVALAFPSPVPGGTVVAATVTLSGPAATDTVVGLTSSDSSVVRVHRAMIVPAGSSSATFLINTYRSHVTKTVTIQATLGSVVQAKDLTITGR